MKKLICGLVFLTVIWLSAFAAGCIASTPVDAITIRKALPDRQIPTIYLPYTEHAFTTGEFAIFSPEDKIYIGLKIKRNLKSYITFTRFTLFDQKTKNEIELDNPEDNPAFKPGQTGLIAFYDPWPVPGDNGIYELRIYYGEHLAAAVTFAVLDD